jgi:hypothetical protein
MAKVPDAPSALSLYNRGHYCQVRTLICDYAVILSIMVFVAIDFYYQLDTPKLIVPTEFKVRSTSKYYCNELKKPKQR